MAAREGKLKTENKFGRAYISIGCLSTLALAILPLSIQRPFYIDWVNHIWSINEFKCYFMQNGDFPLFFNAKSAAGNPAPVFYGFLFYPLMASFAIFLNPDITIRIAAVIIYLAHFAIYYRLAKSVFPAPYALCIATISVSSVYQVSNLYNRSALTEFFSYELFSIAIPLAFVSLWSSDRIRTGLFASSVGLLVAATGMHPPTAYSTALLVAPLLIVSLILIIRERGFRLRIEHVVTLLGVCCVMGPWIYVVARYAAQLEINNDPGHVPGLMYFPTTIDSLFGKLGWLYLDRRTLTDGISMTSTPFLNASLQMPMALICLLLLAVVWSSADRSYRLGLVIMVLICFVTVDLSLRPSETSLVPSPSAYSKILPRGRFLLYDLINPLQFAYRLTNIFSMQLSVILTLIIFKAQRSTLHISLRIRIVFISIVALSFTGLFLQDIEIVTEFSFYGSNSQIIPASAQAQVNDNILRMSWKRYIQQISDVDNYPDTFYSQSNYAMIAEFEAHDFATTPMPWTLAIFAGVRSAEVLETTCTARCLIQTNLLPSAFTVLTLDGVPVPNDRIWNISDRIGFVAAAGPHRVSFRQIGRVLSFFRVARWVGLVWVLASGLYCAFSIVFQHQWHKVFAP